jgi:c(7)-type cytochrome triheme protein
MHMTEHNTTKILSSLSILALLIALTGCQVTPTSAEIPAGAPDKAAMSATEAAVDAAPQPAAKPEPQTQLDPAVAVVDALATQQNPVPSKELDPKPNVQPIPVTPVKINPTDPKSTIYLGSDGKLAGTGDVNKPASAAYSIGGGAHPLALQAATTPKDKFGLADWVAMVNQGLIQPKGSLDPAAVEAPALDLDVVITSKGDFVKDVLFTHRVHNYWFNCDTCHPKFFEMAKGTTKMDMKGIGEGKWCGACHSKVAFPLTDCARCHSQEKAAVGKK